MKVMWNLLMFKWWNELSHFFLLQDSRALQNKVHQHCPESYCSMPTSKQFWRSINMVLGWFRKLHSSSAFLMFFTLSAVNGKLSKLSSAPNLFFKPDFRGCESAVIFFLAAQFDNCLGLLVQSLIKLGCFGNVFRVPVGISEDKKTFQVKDEQVGLTQWRNGSCESFGWENHKVNSTFFEKQPLCIIKYWIFSNISITNQL